MPCQYNVYQLLALQLLAKQNKTKQNKKPAFKKTEKGKNMLSLKTHDLLQL